MIILALRDDTNVRPFRFTAGKTAGNPAGMLAGTYLTFLPSPGGTAGTRLAAGRSPTGQ